MCMFKDFVEKNNYDIRVSKDARWIDQKCTYDVVSIIADCILMYVESKSKNGNNSDIEFTVRDIWGSEYTRENVMQIFSKPDPKTDAKNEYDKYFSQPIKLLNYSKVLTSRKQGKTYYYKILENSILLRISLRPMNALNFLYEYITKVLKDSGIYTIFEEFFNIQNIETYKNVKDSFVKFTIDNTNINKDTECGRIFTKIINPLAFKLNKLGTKGGYISRNIITLNDLAYNKTNWRDEYSGKEKRITRNEHNTQIEYNTLIEEARSKYTTQKAIRIVSQHNSEFMDSKSEIIQDTGEYSSLEAHHIFPRSEFPALESYLENIIMITPSQHSGMAHPQGNSHYVDKDYQYICLLAKSKTIMFDLEVNLEQSIYNFNDYVYVLGKGLNSEEFDSVTDRDFATIVNKIDYCFAGNIGNNKYCHLIEENKMSL